jgi:hypothetical protein
MNHYLRHILILNCYLHAVFNYIPLIHNVVIVNEFGYNSCVALGGSGFYNSGADRITLAKGVNYFICGILGHCNLGMKIAVNAS